MLPDGSFCLAPPPPGIDATSYYNNVPSAVMAPSANPPSEALPHTGTTHTPTPAETVAVASSATATATAAAAATATAPTQASSAAAPVNVSETRWETAWIFLVICDV